MFEWFEGKVRSGKLRKGKVGKGQVKISQVKTGQVGTDPVRTGQLRDLNSNPDRLSQYRSSQVRTYLYTCILECSYY